ncbi:MAG TPA: polynucleotide kinase-phosphatase [Myxococcaceae bacterium]|nr:polynucleotide kinase-phosphatase [Myxococcaceae bacterium]
MRLSIPELSFVVLIGPSGCGKSTFARRHFKPTEILTSDVYRGLVSDDENDQTATEDAFDALYYVARKRLAAGRLTVLDATNVQLESRMKAVAVAREYHMLPVAIVFDLPERVCHERNATRPDRQFGPHVIRTQRQQMHRGMRDLQKEGFRHLYRLSSVEEVDAATVVREPLWNNRKSDTGPFDIIGDVHGCADELQALLDRLGYTGSPRRHADGRKVVFLGDLVDRGPAVPEVLRTAMSMVRAGTALCVPGNHEMKLLRKLRGKNVKLTHGIVRTLEQLEREPPELAGEVATFIDDLVSHYVLDGGRLVVAHAGMKAELQGRGSGKVREFALYGETTGETDEYGLPIRYPWASEYRGRATVVYGHTPVPEAEWLNNTICIDTGCVYGGKLTALRWPERELVQVPARQMYCEPVKPLGAPAAPGLSAQQQVDDALDLADVVGKRVIETRLHRTVTVREENASAALEVMSRFAVDPRWLVYLPPTMSPVETSRREGFLEYPEEAFEYFRRQGVTRVVCEEKHMGSRAVLVVCRTAEVARARFGVTRGEQGVIYTRTGRPFFTDDALESALLSRLLAALESSGFWAEQRTEWAVIDAELMPWSLKAESLLRKQYAAVGAAAGASLTALQGLVVTAEERRLELGDLPVRVADRASLTGQYVEAYRRYCWPVRSVGEVKLAPFHLLATEGAVHAGRDHGWHMQSLAKVCTADPEVLLATPYRVVDLSEPLGVLEATRWWEELTGKGGEGMVVKPLDFIARSDRGLVQPAVKCRGPEYLRIIYGPEYTLPENLGRLRNRGLGHKRSLALREFALGIEALERFVRREPLRRVHECVFGVLALESEPVDPRL